jgi:hypothetical protein
MNNRKFNSLQYEQPLVKQLHTIESLAKAVGLKEPGLFKVESEADNPRHPRSSGRTTRTILLACVASQKNRVLILGHNWIYTKQLLDQTITYCKQGGINPSNIMRFYIPVGTSVESALRGREDVIILEDHYRDEMAWGRLPRPKLERLS